MEYLSPSIIICCASTALCRGKNPKERRVWDKEKVASSSTFYNNPSSVKVASLYEEDENCDENLKFGGDDNDINEEIRYEGFAEKFWATLQNR